MQKYRILTLAAALLLTAAAAQAASVWGTASDINATWGAWDGSTIFQTDLDSGATTILRNYTWSNDSIMWFGDIAHAPNGWLYATAYEYNGQNFSDGFDQLLKIDPADGSIAGRWDLGGYYNQINALTAVDGETLYGVEGGGFDNANLVEIALNGSGDLESQQRLGEIGDQSDGDIAFDEVSGQFFVGSFWDGSQPVLRSIDAGPPASGSNYVNLEAGYTSGLVFSDRQLWASNWTHMRLYTINTADGSFTDQFDLSSALSNTGVTGITGLSEVAESTVVPEPLTILSATLGLGAAAGYLRRRRNA
jgi:hypothetical protein